MTAFACTSPIELATETSTPIANSAVNPAVNQGLSGWQQAIAYPAREFSQTALKIISGKLPSGLRGTLYRNGPARLQRGNQWAGHWFDGDGAVLGVQFLGGNAQTQAQATYQFVRTQAYLDDEQANAWTQGSYGMVAPIGQFPPMAKPIRQLLRHPANTSVLALPDRLLALWEQGHPYRLDPQTLTTLGQENFQVLREEQPYAAHYKRDPQTGEIFNFGVTYGMRPMLNVYRSDRYGKIQQQQQIPLNCLPIIHDCLLAGKYLVFFIPPVRLNPFPVLANQQSFSDSLSWKSELGTQILILDRQTLNVITHAETEPFYLWHFGNGYVNSAGEIVGTFVHYHDFSTNTYLQQVGLLQPQTAAPGTLWQFRLDPFGGKILATHQLSSVCGEFPIVSPHYVGQAAPQTYMSAFRPGADIATDLWSTIASFDHTTGNMTVADLGAHRYAIEPTYAPDPEQPDQGWLLTVVYDSQTHTSEVWIYAASRLNDEPLCRLALPDVIPMGYHGCWAAA